MNVKLPKLSSNRNRKKKQWVLFFTGLIAIIIGVSIFSFFGIQKIHREMQEKKLIDENVVIEIVDLKIKAPVLEGTDKETLAKAAGHFAGTGEVGSGNYCIAGHSSTLYKEYFNNLKNIKTGMEINLYNKDKQCFTYIVTESFIIEPNETWVLNDFKDNRVTIITCTDSGTQRLVVVGQIIDKS